MTFTIGNVCAILFFLVLVYFVFLRPFLERFFESKQKKQEQGETTYVKKKACPHALSKSFQYQCYVDDDDGDVLIDPEDLFDPRDSYDTDDVKHESIFSSSSSCGSGNDSVDYSSSSYDSGGYDSGGYDSGGGDSGSFD